MSDFFRMAALRSGLLLNCLPCKRGGGKELQESATTKSHLVDSICAACQNFPLELFTSNLAGGRFVLHPSLKSLLKSAAAGCKFCVFLQRRLGIDSANVLPQPSSVLLFSSNDGNIWGNVGCQIYVPYPRYVERPRRMVTSFQFSVEPFDGTRRPIRSDTSSEETFLQIKKWLDQCDAGHTNCNKPASDEGFLPTRLIDLQSMTATGSETSPRLIFGADLASNYVKYIALSYARSSDDPQDSNPQVRTTTEENVNDHLSSGIPLSKLPLTVREGIDIAQRLKIRYIWDPSLCIIQDSPSDRRLRSALIPKIFAHAYVTIAASASANVHEGYFRDSEKTTEHDSALFSVSAASAPSSSEGREKTQVLVMKEQLSWGASFMAGPLNNGAWAIQEREFSPRIVHFTETQVLWECRALRATEGVPERNIVGFADEWPRFPPRLLDGLHEIDEQSLDEISEGDMWLQTVVDYSEHKLENPLDKFPALASLAEIFASHNNHGPDDYIAGLWKHDLVRSLPWGSSTARSIYSAVLNTRHKTYIAPTWSWASVDGAITFSYLKEMDYSILSSLDSDAREAVKLMPKIVGLQLPFVTQADPFGPLKVYAELRVTGYLVPAALNFASVSRVELGLEILLSKAGSTQSLDPRSEAVGLLYFDVPSERAALNPKEEVFVLYVHPWHRRGYRFGNNGEICALGIALVRIGQESGMIEGRGYYRRVGHVRPLVVQWFESVREEEIVII